MSERILHTPEGPDEGYEQEKHQPVNAADRSEMPARMRAVAGDARRPVPNMLREAADEIDSLHTWKAEATAVIEGWERVFEMVPEWFLRDRLGRPKSETTAAYINRLLHP